MQTSSKKLSFLKGKISKSRCLILDFMKNSGMRAWAK